MNLAVVSASSLLAVGFLGGVSPLPGGVHPQSAGVYPQSLPAASSNLALPTTAQLRTLAPAAARMPSGCKVNRAWTASEGVSYRPGRFCLKSTVKYSSWLVFEKNGNLVHYGGSPLRKMWQSRTGGQGANRLAFQRDGNVVIYRNTTPLWSTGTHWDKRPPATEFLLGIPPRDRNIDQAKFILVVNPRWVGGRPALSGGRTAWDSSRAYKPAGLSTDYNVIRDFIKTPGPIPDIPRYRITLSQRKTGAIAQGGDNLKSVADDVCSLVPKVGPAACKAVLKLTLGGTSDRARGYYNAGDCYAIHLTTGSLAPSRVHYGEYNCVERIPK